MSAVEIFMKYADKDGFVSLKDLAKVGWSKSKAEEEGLVVKDSYRRYEHVC